MPSIFLSYSREDEALARRLVAALENGGATVWWDGLLEGGERFADTIADALDSADVVVVLWSARSARSHWVQDEAARGRDRGRLVPVTLDGTPPPLGFGQLQSLNFAKWNGRAKAPEVEALLRAIATSAGQPEQVGVVSAGPGTGTSRRKLLIGGGAVLALAGGGLAAWQSGVFATNEPGNSIAVLPFRNLSGDKSQDYFAEGIAEEVRNSLSRNPQLKVIATTSSNMFREQAEPLPDIAAKLGVASILDGSVRREDDQVRIGLQLINGSDGVTQWSKSLDRKFAEVLAIQTEVATEVLRVLNIQIGGEGIEEENGRRRTGATTKPAAFDAFLAARAEFEKFNFEGFEGARRRSQQARSIDPDYASAYALEARALVNLWRMTDGPDRSQLDQALELAHASVKLAPLAPYCLVALSGTMRDCNQFAGSHEFSRRAIAEGPDNLAAQIHCSLWNAVARRFDRARALLGQAKEIDPLNARVWLVEVNLSYWSSDYAEALRLAEALWKNHPDFLSKDDYLISKIQSNTLLGNLDQATALTQQLENRDLRESFIALLAARSGDVQTGQNWIDTHINPENPDVDDQWSQMILLAQMGKASEAMQILERRMVNGAWVSDTVNVDPFFEPIRRLPDYSRFIKRHGIIG